MSSISQQRHVPAGWETAAVIALLLFVVFTTFFLQVISTHVKQTRRSNRKARAKLFKRLGLTTVTPFTDLPLPRRTVVGFFHPFCNAGGGGERVLWQAVEHHLRQDDRMVVVIYSGDVGPEASLETSDEERANGASGVRLRDGSISTTKEEILEKCNSRFAIPIHLPEFAGRIHFLPLSHRLLVSDSYWARLTLLGQAYGSMRMAFEACSQLLPDVFIDTMGYAFAYPVVRMFQSRMPIGAYVHYPMISTDMLQRVKDRMPGHTNSDAVSGSRWRSAAKLTYYRGFAWAYASALRASDVIVANGTWTRDHLNQLTLKGKEQGPSNARFTRIVYPPCDTASLNSSLLQGRANMVIVSLAQFRPEKEHAMQIRLVKEVLNRRRRAGESVASLRLVCMGSSRNEGDEQRIHNLKALVAELDVGEHVEFVINASYPTIVDYLCKASVGLSTMVDEHFGINVVEFMAAGLITLSHASAGPMLDIAVPTSDGDPIGFHANTLADFADALQHIFALDEAEGLAIRKRARRRAMDTFSNEAFCRAWDDNVWQRLIQANANDKKKTQ